ncbi:MAG TPA: VWA domain-containing protein [Solirubrobacterales bacterium]|jgi:hypothetical protein
MGSEADELIARVGALVGEMRRRGAVVGTGQLLAAHRALAEVDVADPRQSRAALRATLCSGPDDVRRFDAALAGAFAAPAAEEDDEERRPAPGGGSLGAAHEDDAEAGEDGEQPIGAWSAAAALRQKDFAALDEAELEQVRRAVARLAHRFPTRRTARLRRAARRRERIDVRAGFRAALRAEIESPRPRWRERTTGPRPLVLVCDASRSMAPYSRPLLQYAQACVATRIRVEVFVLGTRLTRVTRELVGRDPDGALARAIDSVDDWDSGTRIGASLHTLTHRHAGRLGRGATVVVFSDGWDRGDPDLVRAEMERIARCAHRVIWVNPYSADPEFEPLARGMAAALPSVDHLRAGNSLAGLEDLVALMSRI